MDKNYKYAQLLGFKNNGTKMYVHQLYMYWNSKVRDQSTMLCDQLLRSTLSAHCKNDIARKVIARKVVRESKIPKSSQNCARHTRGC